MIIGYLEPWGKGFKRFTEGDWVPLHGSLRFTRSYMGLFGFLFKGLQGFLRNSF